MDLGELGLLWCEPLIPSSWFPPQLCLIMTDFNMLPAMAQSRQHAACFHSPVLNKTQNHAWWPWWGSVLRQSDQGTSNGASVHAGRVEMSPPWHRCDPGPLGGSGGVPQGWPAGDVVGSLGTP